MSLIPLILATRALEAGTGPLKIWQPFTQGLVYTPSPAEALSPGVGG
jgi:hypothetical protein